MLPFLYWLASAAKSDSHHIFGLWAFLAVSDGEFYYLAVGEGFEPVTLDGAEVYEDVGAVLSLDETKSLGFVEPFDGTGDCRHRFYLYYCAPMPLWHRVLHFIYVEGTEELRGTPTASINTTGYPAVSV